MIKEVFKMSNRQSKKQKSLIELGFAKRLRKDEENLQEEKSEDLVKESAPGPSQPVLKSNAPAESSSTSGESEILVSSGDIAFYLNKQLTGEDKYKIFNSLTVPDPGYKFPLTSFGQKNRAFQVK